MEDDLQLVEGCLELLRIGGRKSHGLNGPNEMDFLKIVSEYNPWALYPIEYLSLTSICLHAKMKGFPTILEALKSSSVVDFLDQDYRYKSVAAQISHYAGLEPVRRSGIEPGTTVSKAVTLPCAMA